MRASVTLFLSFLLAVNASAQAVQLGSLAPDFVSTDINGTQHRLYDYLDQGYTVVLDFSATWCGPCWNNHQAGILGTLYAQHGPGTADDKVMVLMAEVDAGTDLADLQGTGDQTMGDWVTGTPYPILDDAQVGLRFGIVSFPMVFTICPDRRVTHMSSVGWPSASGFWAQAQECQALYTADRAVDATLVAPVQLDPCDPYLVLQNLGTSPLEAARIRFQVPDAFNNIHADTLEWTGHLDTYQAAVIHPHPDLPMGWSSVACQLISADDRPENDSTRMDLVSTMPVNGTELRLDLHTDANGAGTGWGLAEVGSAPIQQVDAGAYAANGTYSYTWTLQLDACHVFSIYYALGGLEAPGQWQLSANGAVFAQSSIGLPYELVYFRPQLANGLTERVAPTRVHPRPNPMTTATTIDLTPTHGNVVLTIHDAMGRLVRQEAVIGGRVVTLERGSLTPGCYVLLLTSADGTVQGARLLVE